MTRAGWVGVCGLCLSLSVACGRGAEDARNDPDDDLDIEQTAAVAETGCLTASGDRFVLTALESGGATETELYQLIGDSDELRKYVGREVRITGDAEPAQVAELRESSSAPAGTSGATADAQRQGQPAGGAQVRTESNTRLETRQLRVATVAPTGDQCPSAPAR